MGGGAAYTRGHMGVTFQHRRLPSGMTIVAETSPDAHSAAVGFFVRTGARDEASASMGVSHFLEHMMFKGTARRSADDVNRDFDAIGAKYNAYTTSEMTCFHAQTLPERLFEATDILADILRPALRQEDFDTEKNVILEEIAMYKDNPFWVLYEETIARRYGRHPLAHRVLGTTETVGALTRDAMQRYFDSRYSADNTVVALAGKLDFDSCVDHVSRLCEGWAATRPARDAAAPAAPANERFTLRDAKAGRAYWLRLAPAPSLADPSRYAAMMLSLVLGGPDSSRLHWALIEEGLADEAQSGYDPHDGCGDFYVYFSCDPERVAQVEAVVERELAGLMASLTEDDLVRLRNKLATSVTLAGERPAGRMQRIGRLWTYLRQHLTLEEELAAINAVTLDDLRAVHAAYPFSPCTTGVLSPASPQGAGG